MKNALKAQGMIFDSKEVGCHLDGSAMSADYINRRTVRFAEDYGFTFDDDLENIDSEILSELGDEAIEYLNENCVSDEVCFCFEDNSLFLMEVEVVYTYGGKERFIVGRSTWFIPCHIAIKRIDSTGGCAVSSVKSVRLV